MPMQPPHHVSSQEFQNPHSAFMRYAQLRETNPIPARPTTKNAKRTQSTPTPACPAIQKCETNPISTTPTIRRPKNAKRTQFAPPPPSHDPKIRNEPNLPPSSHHPTTQKCETNPIYPTPTIPRPKNTKRTQFAPQPPSTIHNIQYTIYNLQSPPQAEYI